MKKLLFCLFIFMFVIGGSAAANESDLIRASDIPQDVIDFVDGNTGEVVKVNNSLNNQVTLKSKATWGGGFRSYSIRQTYDDIMNIDSNDFLKLANIERGWLFYIYKNGKPGPMFNVNYVKGRLTITDISGDSTPYIEALNAMINAHGKDRNYVVAASGDFIVDITDKNQTFLLTTGSEYDKTVFPISELINNYKQTTIDLRKKREQYEKAYRKKHNLPDDAEVPITSGGLGAFSLAKFVPSSPDVSEASQQQKVRMLVVFGAMTLLLGVSAAFFYSKKKRDLTE